MATGTAAIAGLFLSKLTRESSPAQVESYVRAAARDGIALEQIAELARIPLNRVALIVKEK